MSAEHTCCDLSGESVIEVAAVEEAIPECAMDHGRQEVRVSRTWQLSAVLRLDQQTGGRLNSLLLNRFTPAQLLSWGLPLYSLTTLAATLPSGTGTVWMLFAPLWIAMGMLGLLTANAMALAMAAASDGAGTGSALLGAVQFGLAFAVSTCVALGGTGSLLPMALGMFVPAVAATLLWAAAHRRTLFQRRRG